MKYGREGGEGRGGEGEGEVVKWSKIFTSKGDGEEGREVRWLAEGNTHQEHRHSSQPTEYLMSSLTRVRRHPTAVAIARIVGVVHS